MPAYRPDSMRLSHLIIYLMDYMHMKTYTNKDKVLDALVGSVLVVAFVLLWCAGSLIDLALVGY